MDTIQREKPEEIVIFTERHGMMVMVIISIVCGVFFGLLVIAASISFIVSPDQRNAETVGGIVVFLGFAILSLWLIRSTIGLAKPGTPMLIINRTGIRAGTRTYGSTEFVLPWQEIQAIYVLGANLYLRPGNKQRLFSDFNPLKRFLLTITFPKDIYISQMYLQKPVREIFHLLEDFFSYELETYHIQLHP